MFFKKNETNSEGSSNDVKMAGKIKGDKISGRKVDLNGTIDVNCINGEEVILNGKITAKEVKFNEYANLKGAIVVDKIESRKGNVDILGKVNSKKLEAETIKYKVDGAGTKSNINQIKGINVEITSRLKENTIDIKEIRADRVYVEYASVGNIFANEVEVGAGCDIKKINYSNKCNVSKESNVENVEKSL